MTSKADKLKKMKCGLIMPISAIDDCSENHWKHVRNIIEEALEDANLSIELVSDADEVGVIQKRIIQNIYDNDIVICDVSCKNPNVMFELGMRLAFDKPAVIIKDDVTPYSFDTSPVEHLSYPRGLHYHHIQAFKKKLRNKVLSTLEAAKEPKYTTFLGHFGKFVVANIDEKPLEKDEYILEALQELRKDMNRLRTEQYEVYLTNRTSQFAGFGNPHITAPTKHSQQYLSSDEYVKAFLASRDSLTKSEVDALTDPNSEVFKGLYHDFIDNSSDLLTVRDAHTAKKQLLDSLHTILP